MVCIGNYTATDLPDGGRLTEANITRDLVIVNIDIVVQSIYNVFFGPSYWFINCLEILNIYSFISYLIVKNI